MRSGAAILPTVALLFTGGVSLTTAHADPGADPHMAIACDPPLDRPLRLTVTQHMWLADGSAASATVTRGLRFVRDAKGVVVEARIAALDTDQPGRAGADARARMLLAYGAPGEVPITIRLDAAMAIREVESLDRLWWDFRDRQVRLNKAMANGGKPNARTQAMIHALDAMGDPEKRAVLTSFLAPVLRHCGTMAPAGTVLGADGMLHTETRADSAGTSDVARYAIDSRTGLLRSLDRIVSSADTPLHPLRETWTLTQD